MAGGSVDDGVNEGEGVRLAGEKGGLSPVPVPVSGGAEVSLFTDRANQLLVAAIACLTAWRPLSSTLFPDVVVPRRSLAGVTPAGRSLPVFWSLPDGPLSECALPDDGLSDDARFDGAAVSGAVSVSTAGLPLGPLGLRIMSAGNGTGTCPGAAAPSSAFASASASAAAGVAVPS